MSRKLKMPWSMEDTIENMKHVKDAMIKIVRQVNLEGEGEEDVREINFDFGRVITALKETQQYREIGTVEECREAVEKQRAKKPNLEGDGYADGHMVYDTWICPCCGISYEIDYDDYKYCPDCGQRIDWSE